MFLYDVVSEFWNVWFPESSIDLKLLTYIVEISTIAIVLILLYSFISIFLGKKNLFRIVCILVLCATTVVYVAPYINIIEIRNSTIYVDGTTATVTTGVYDPDETDPSDPDETEPSDSTPETTVPETEPPVPSNIIYKKLYDYSNHTVTNCIDDLFILINNKLYLDSNCENINDYDSYYFYIYEGQLNDEQIDVYALDYFIEPLIVNNISLDVFYELDEYDCPDYTKPISYAYIMDMLNCDITIVITAGA